MEARLPINFAKCVPNPDFRQGNARIYFGEPYKDPQQYPIPLTGDSGTLDNPVMITAGVLPRVYVNADFISLLVIDDHGRQVLYKPNISTQVICG